MPTNGDPRQTGAVMDSAHARESLRLSLVSGAHRDLAHWLFEHELGKGAADQAELAVTLERICAEFFTVLARVTSLAACQALLSRALHIPRADFAFLKGVRAGPNAEPVIEGLPASVGGVELGCVRAGLEAVLGTLIDLLAGVIGEDLTRGMLREVWRELAAFQSQPATAASAQETVHQ